MTIGEKVKVWTVEAFIGFKMTFYSVRLIYIVKRHPQVTKNLDKINITKSELVKGIIEPYLKGIKFEFDNELIDPSEVAGFDIYETENTWSDFEDAVEYGDDVTEEFLNVPIDKTRRTQKRVVASKDVFVVHGHDIQSVNELKKMLIEFGLNPIVLHEKASGSRTLVEKLEKYSNVGYAFVVLTPDDVGCLKKEYANLYNLSLSREGENEDTRKGNMEFFFQNVTQMLINRARQNVILEFGFFMGRLGRDRVCCLYNRGIELPSDMHGIVYIPFKISVNEIRLKIMKELKEAGYEIEL